jgi:hypothetical protein
MFIIYPQAGKWNLITRDSNVAPLIDNENTATFIHANKFLAVFATKQEALECAFDSTLH